MKVDRTRWSTADDEAKYRALLALLFGGGES